MQNKGGKRVTKEIFEKGMMGNEGGGEDKEIEVAQVMKKNEQTNRQTDK
jgi:hypothetical protein